MANSNSLRPSPLKKTSIHSGSARPFSTSPLAGLPGNIAQGSTSLARVGARGANHPSILGGKR